MRKLFAAAASLLIAATIPATAADMPPAAQAFPAGLFDWNGFYLGASAGYGLGRTDDSYTTARPQPVLVTRHSFNGVFGGVEAGYCRMVGSPFVMCGEVAFDVGRQRGINYAFSTAAQSTYVQSTVTVDWLLTAGPKLGVALDRNQLFIYVSGGGAFAHVALESVSSIPGNIGAGSAATTRGGWFVGAGMERLLTPSLGVKFDYKRVDLAGLDTALAGGAAVRTSALQDNIFSAGVNFHFNGGPSIANY